MNNELALSPNDNFDQFLLKLNQATSFSSGMPTIPMLKFDGEEGTWKEETPEKDEEGKPIYNPIGEQIEMHIITTRKMVQSSFDSKEGLYSREFQDNYVELYDKDNKKVMEGQYQALKVANPNLVFVQVLYVFVNDKPYRIKLSGSKLTKLFPYLSSFVNDNPARWLTIAERGQRLKKGAVNYYELDFKKGDEIADRDLIVKRVNDVNLYLDLYIKARDNRAKVIITQPEEPLMIDEPVEPEINVENIPFG